jgi:thiosulfate/3-mercaptopyruvate sulfurtransferase
MNLIKFVRIGILFLLMSCNNQAEKIIPNYIIEQDEFLKTYQNKNIKIIDFSKPEVYAKRHVAGALNIWRTDIEDASYPYGGMIGSKEQLEALFSNLGITNSDTLLVYDDKGLCDAARFWWVLQNYGFTNFRMLNGGLLDWQEKGNELTKEQPTIAKSNFTFKGKEKDEYSIDKEQVFLAMLANKTIIDTRTENEFSGKTQKKGAFKAGRIPNSKLIDWTRAIDYHGSKKIKSKEELEKIYNTLGVAKNDTIIVYCHSGVRSAHTSFILTQVLGYKNVFNYDGSWTEWSYFDDYPFEKDSITIK